MKREVSRPREQDAHHCHEWHVTTPLVQPPLSPPLAPTIRHHRGLATRHASTAVTDAHAAARFDCTAQYATSPRRIGMLTASSFSRAPPFIESTASLVETRTKRAVRVRNTTDCTRPFHHATAAAATADVGWESGPCRFAQLLQIPCCRHRHRRRLECVLIYEQGCKDQPRSCIQTSPKTSEKKQRKRPELLNPETWLARMPVPESQLTTHLTSHHS
eukprot:6177579-Pleurochrysis_carterae.AAC.1